MFPTCDSVTDTVMGYGRLRELAGETAHIVPGHDPAVMDRYPSYNLQTTGIVAKLDG